MINKDLHDKMVELFGTEEAVGMYFVDQHGQGRYTPAQVDTMNAIFPNGPKLDMVSYLRNDEAACCCTSHARLVKQTLTETYPKVRVEIWGFKNEDNPEALFVREGFHPGGHDFALVNSQFLVDPWLHLLRGQEKWLFDLNDREDRVLVEHLYGHSSNWTRNLAAEDLSVVAKEPTPNPGSGHYYELMDRANTLNIMFDQLIVDHPAAVTLKADVDQIGERLADFYQKAAQLSRDNP